MQRYARLIALTCLIAQTSSAMAQSDVDRILERIRSGRTAAPQEQGSDKAAQATQGGGALSVSPLAKAPEASAIELPAMAVTLKKTYGGNKAFQQFPTKVVIAGYNIGGIRRAVASGRASGGILTSNPGARTTTELIAWGIDENLLTRIADQAHADLVLQIKAAGFDVVSPEQARQAAGYAKLKLGQSPYEGQEALIVGPSDEGARGTHALAKTVFGDMGAPELSNTLQAMIVLPNLMFDFAWTQGSRSWGRTASSSAGLQFRIHPVWSSIRVTSSTRNQFNEGDIVLALAGDAVSDEPFGRIVDTETTDNSASVAMSNALGVGMTARSKDRSTAEIDREKYEALALSAAKGWNAAFVAQLKAATGR